MHLEESTGAVVDIGLGVQAHLGGDDIITIRAAVEVIPLAVFIARPNLAAKAYVSGYCNLGRYKNAATVMATEIKKFFFMLASSKFC